MQIIRLSAASQHACSSAPTAITLGNFDGMHMGHHAVLQQLSEAAQRLGLLSTVVVFEPQPKEWFACENHQAGVVPSRLMRWREKCEYLQLAHIDQVVVLRFDDALRQMSATSFLKNILCHTLQIRYLLVGGDFRFGMGRSGDLGFLQAQADVLGYTVMSAPDVLDAQGERVSSSRIRVALAERRLRDAEALLGRKFSVQGRVCRGQQLGRTLGYPTLNIRPHRLQSPLQGIYAVRVRGLPQGEVNGVASWGTRPAVGGAEFLLEVHCFDFNAQVYGCRVTVVFEHFIREEKDFEGLEALKRQIEMDVGRARGFLGGGLTPAAQASKSQD